MGGFYGEIRNPKLEIRVKSECPNLNVEVNGLFEPGKQCNRRAAEEDEVGGEEFVTADCADYTDLGERFNRQGAENAKTEERGKSKMFSHPVSALSAARRLHLYLCGRLHVDDLTAVPHSGQRLGVARRS